MKQSQVTQAKNENAATRYQHRGLAWVGETSIWNISFSFTGGFEGTKTKIRINTSWLKEELPLTRLKMRNQISNPSTSTFNIGGITIFRNVGLEVGRDTHKFSLRKVRNLPFPCLTANKILQPSFAATTAVPWRLSRFYSCPIDHIPQRTHKTIKFATWPPKQERMPSSDFHFRWAMVYQVLVTTIIHVYPILMSEQNVGLFSLNLRVVSFY